MDPGEYDNYVRAAAFAWLDRLVRANGVGTIRSEEAAAFVFDGVRIPLIATQQGIRKPKQLDAALSVRTVYARRPDQRPYEDGQGEDGLLRYKWRGLDGNHYENVALRLAMWQAKPLIWFQGVGPALYLPIYPVWIVGEEAELHQFVVDPDSEPDRWEPGDLVDLSARRRYAERTVRSRLHQPLFRARVLEAYGRRCAICRLRHTELLDAAHILADADGGEPVVPNGIAMCKIHHAAYDHGLVGIRPRDLRLQVRTDVLEEVDGPTLRHTLQAVHDTELDVPNVRAARPDRELLEVRWNRFREAG